MVIIKYLRRLGLFIRANSVSLSLAVITVALFGILTLMAVQQSRMADQISADQRIIDKVSSIAEQLQSGAAQRTQQYNDINKHLDCIAEFFSRPNHAQESIVDIETCQISPTEGTSTQVAPKPVMSQNTVIPQPTPATKPAPAKPTSTTMENYLKSFGGFINSMVH